jgi:hypothetical protein
MKKIYSTLLLMCVYFGGINAQIDTISSNIYQVENKLSIGTTEPFAPLSVVNANTEIHFNSLTAIADFQRTYENSTSRLLLFGYPNTDLVLPHLRKSIMMYATGDANDFIICAAKKEGKIRFITQDWDKPESEKMRINELGNVGIGTTDPFSTLSVVNHNDEIYFNSLTNIADFQRTYENSTARLTIYGYPNTELVLPHLRSSIMLYASGDADDLVICAAKKEGKIRFVTQDWDKPESEKMRIDPIGNVGIGTTAPKARLQVADGDIYISDIEKGIIMKSPDGQCWRGVLNDSGILSFSSIDCPESNVIIDNPEDSIIIDNPVDTLITIEPTDTLTDVNELKKADQVTIFPNPAENIVTIEISNTEVKNLTYSIYFINGKIKEQGKITSNFQIIDITSYTSGNYIVRVSDKQGKTISTNRLIKN